MRTVFSCLKFPLLLICFIPFLHTAAFAADSLIQKKDTLTIKVLPAPEGELKAKAKVPEAAKENIKVPMAAKLPDEYEVPIKPMPADTMDKFLKAYGKDSLLHLIKDRVSDAQAAVKRSLNLLADQLITMEVQLLNQHYKLGYDDQKYFSDTRGFFMHLYDVNSASPANFIDTAKFRNIPAESFYDVLGRYIPDRFARIGICGLSPYLNIGPDWIDSLNQYSGRLNNFGRIELYYTFAEYVRNNPGKNPNAVKYKKALFDELYKDNNLSRLFGADESADKLDRSGLLDPFSFMAYGLYGNDITLKQNGRDIMYLLSLQMKDGSWRLVNGMGADASVSIYGLWSLLELRDKLSAK